ncbi:hypothetical protein BGX26_007526 [Mortierella sp. AD094]|nr:hypothetical protein BGX26_007526 [Mortierella sp. AD094]
MTESRCNNATKATIVTATEYARGAFKKVYGGKYTDGSRTGQSCVSKVFITGSVFEHSYFQHEMDVVRKATEIVRAFNGLELINKKIIINQPEVWKFEGDQSLTLIEPMIENFEKFNSNTGWTQDATSWGQAMQALAHFSFHHSHGQLTLCDLQGGVYSDGIILTDPVVMSTNQRFGPTDLGKDGIDSFFSRHVCNNFCRASWTRPFRKTAIFPVTKGTTMMQVKTQIGRSLLTQRSQAENNLCKCNSITQKALEVGLYTPDRAYKKHVYLKELLEKRYSEQPKEGVLRWSNIQIE